MTAWEPPLQSIPKQYRPHYWEGWKQQRRGEPMDTRMPRDAEQAWFNAGWQDADMQSGNLLLEKSQ